MFIFIVSVLGVNTLTHIYKRVLTKYGPTRVQIAAGVFSLLIALIIKMFGTTPIFHNVLEYSAAVFASALTLYHVLWKKLSDLGIDSTDLNS